MRIFFSSAIFLLFFCVSAYAGSKREAARCVQSQLTALDMEPGGIDGQIGGKSRAAYLKLKEINPSEYGDLPNKLSAGNAAYVCRKIGTADASMQQYWPSKKKKWNLQLEPKLGDYGVSAFELAFSNIDKFLDQEELHHIGTFNIWVAKTKAGLRRFYLRKIKVSNAKATFNKAYDRSCLKRKQAGGFFIDGHVFVCLFDSDDKSKTYNLNDIKRVLRHEVFHALQYEYLSYPVIYSKNQSLKKWGPFWLVEGSAQHFEILESLGNGVLRHLALKIALKDTKGELSKFERRPKNRTRFEQAYYHGLKASDRLANNHAASLKQFAEFYERIGIGTAWKKSFEESFGISVKEFYSAYKNDTPVIFKKKRVSKAQAKKRLKRLSNVNRSYRSAIPKTPAAAQQQKPFADIDEKVLAFTNCVYEQIEEYEPGTYTQVVSLKARKAYKRFRETIGNNELPEGFSFETAKEICELNGEQSEKFAVHIPKF